MQAIIFITSALAIWFAQSGNAELIKWACIVALPGQPFWLISTYRAKQQGIFAVSLFYTGAYLFGLWTYWIKPAL